MGKLGLFKTKCTPVKFIRFQEGGREVTGDGDKRVGYCENFPLQFIRRGFSGFAQSLRYWDPTLGRLRSCRSPLPGTFSKSVRQAQETYKAACTVCPYLLSWGLCQSARSHACSLSQGHHMKQYAIPGCVAKGEVPRCLSHAFLDPNRVDR